MDLPPQPPAADPPPAPNSSAAVAAIPQAGTVFRDIDAPWCPELKSWWPVTAALGWIMTRDLPIVARLCKPLSGIEKGAIILECARRGNGVAESKKELIGALAAGKVTAYGNYHNEHELKPISAVQWSRLKFGFETGPDRAGPYTEIVLQAAEVARHWRPTGFRDIDSLWCPELVVIPPGEFLMGSPDDDPQALRTEGPQHRMRIGYSLAVGRYPVTFEEYDHFCEQIGRRPPADSGEGRGRRPVINVSWDDAKAYVEWLAAEAGKPYRLLTEAEWEYACRAGTTTRYWWGDKISNDKANCDESGISEVGSYPANPLALHDMHGGVWEWLEDKWHEIYEGAPEDGAAWVQGDRFPSGTARGLLDSILRSTSDRPTA